MLSILLYVLYLCFSTHKKYIKYNYCKISNFLYFIFIFFFNKLTHFGDLLLNVCYINNWMGEKRVSIYYIHIHNSNENENYK